jgi:DNA-binding MarR family transcriptional regulator
VFPFLSPAVPAERNPAGCDDPRLLLEHAPALTRRLYGQRAESRTQAARDAGKELPPTAVALQVLVVINDVPDLDFDQIADRLALDASTVRHAIRSLIAAGLLESNPDPDDGRRRIRVVTAAGRRRAAELAAEARRLLNEHQRPES